MGVGQIILRNGSPVLLDAADVEWLSQWRWCALGLPAYAGRQEHNRTIFMHRLIMGAAPGQFVDHINGSRLDNRRSNLRFCSRAENNRNRAGWPNSASGFKGVIFEAARNHWRAYIMADGRVYTRVAKTALEAAVKYDELAVQHHGKFARLNFPDGVPT